MSEVGDFLESLHDVQPGFRTVTATIRHSDPNAASNEDDAVFRIVFVPPARARIEECRSREGEKTKSITLYEAPTWQRRGPADLGVSGVVHASSTCPWLYDVQRHFDKAFLRVCLARMTFAFAGELTFCGAQCCRIRAVPDSSRGLWPHWLPYPADQYDLIVESARGTVLSISAYGADTIFAVNEVTDLKYDAEIDWGVVANRWE
jgi:hypothetical protein